MYLNRQRRRYQHRVRFESVCARIDSGVVTHLSDIYQDPPACAFITKLSVGEPMARREGHNN